MDAKGSESLAVSQDRADELIRRLNDVRRDMAQAAEQAGRSPGDVRLVAVSKHHSAADVAVLARAGQVAFGENYVQEALEKQQDLATLGIDWHFIGGLQTNKAKFVAGRFCLVHSVDSVKLAQVLHKKALAAETVQDMLIQVNLGREEQKYGIMEENLSEVVDEVAGLSGLNLVGFMTMPPYWDEPERCRPLFCRLRELRDAMERRVGRALPELSMGMTGDFAEAIAEGATLVRIGTRIFGPRP